jgi:hypothetical protein
MRVQFEGVGAFRAEMSTRDRGLRITFNGDQLPVLVIHKLATAHTAIRTNGARHVRAMVLGPQIERTWAHGFGAGSIGSSLHLANQWPA